MSKIGDSSQHSFEIVITIKTNKSVTKKHKKAYRQRTLVKLKDKNTKFTIAQ